MCRETNPAATPARLDGDCTSQSCDMQSNVRAYESSSSELLVAILRIRVELPCEMADDVEFDIWAATRLSTILAKLPSRGACTELCAAAAQ